MTLPAGMINRCGAALNVYDAISGYKSAGKHTADWTKRNPEAWNLVSKLLAERNGWKGQN